MARLSTFAPRRDLDDPEAIVAFLAERGVRFARWHSDVPLPRDADPEAVLAAYAHELYPYLRAHGYATADVVCIDETTPNLPALRDKFLREHTHAEDEVRFFVAGHGDFWFHLTRAPASNAGAETPAPQDEVFCVRCVAGELISVPAGTPHWFDAGERPYVKAIRIFTDAAGWVPHYTGSGLEARYST